MATAPRPSFDSLQAGRGIAAMAVVCFHAGIYVDQQVGPLPGYLSSAFSFGYLGVDFFFVLSGFIIYHSNYARVWSPGWSRGYAESRLTRIYLPYLPIGIAVAALYVLAPGLRHAETPWGWFSTLTLLPSGKGPALHVAWTLQHEIVFYGVIFLLLRSRMLLPGCLAWAALILLLLPLRLATAPGVAPIDLEFILGTAVAYAFATGSRPPPVLLAIFAAAAVGAFALFPYRELSLLVGLAIALLLLPLVRAEAEGRLRLARPLVLLGDASYAIYLVHLPVLSLVVRLCHGVAPAAAAAIGITASAAAGLAYHKLFEKPVLAVVRRLLPRMRREKEEAVAP